MSVDSLSAEVQLALENSGVCIDVAVAALNDYVRSLHEVFTKSGRDQSNLLSQVQTAFGSTCAHHLARVISDEKLKFRSYSTGEDCPLENSFGTLCRQRGIALDRGRALSAHFIKALDEERFDEDAIQSPMFITYWTVGDEAAYHLGCLFVGDDGDEISTEMHYLDRRLVRFRTIVERWEMEVAWDKEGQE